MELKITNPNGYNIVLPPSHNDLPIGLLFLSQNDLPFALGDVEIGQI